MRTRRKAPQRSFAPTHCTNAVFAIRPPFRPKVGKPRVAAARFWADNYARCDGIRPLFQRFTGCAPMSIGCSPHARPTLHPDPETAHSARLDFIGTAELQRHISTPFQTLPLKVGAFRHCPKVSPPLHIAGRMQRKDARPAEGCGKPPFLILKGEKDNPTPSAASSPT